MAASIVSQSYGGLELSPDKVLTLGNEEYLRTFVFGSSWTKVRLGVMCAVHTSATVSAVTFAIGVCSGKTNGLGAANTTNFVGANLTSTASILGNINNAYGPPFYWYSDGIVPVKKVGSTHTYGSGAGNAYGHYTSQNLRFCYFVDITKGSPNYTISVHQYIHVFSPYLQTPVFIASLNSIATPPDNCSTALNGVTIACDESAGAFDTFNLFYNNAANYMDVCSLSAVRLIA